MHLLLFGVARFALMPHRQDQHDFLGWQPAILRDVAVPPARQYEFATTVFGCSAEKWVVREYREGCPHARQLRQCLPGIRFGGKVEEALQVTKRPRAYFDARHERARGRRGFLPSILAAR